MWRLLTTAVKYSPCSKSALKTFCHRNNHSVLSYNNTNDRQNNRRASLGALSHCLQRYTECNAAEVCIFFIRAKIRSVFEKIIGPYEVCIFVNIGPVEKTGALEKVPKWNSSTQPNPSRTFQSCQSQSPQK